MEKFPHLKFTEKIIGSPRGFGGGKTDPKTLENKRNRTTHSNKLQRWVTGCKENWNENIEEREQNNLAPLDSEIQPIFLQVNPAIIGVDFDLQKFGIEIISEEENGYIIGASLDNFRSLESKIEDFITNQYGSAKIAEFWDIHEGNREIWKPEHILSPELYENWNNILEDNLYNLEVSIAFGIPTPKEPKLDIQNYERKLAEYRSACMERDEKMEARQENFQNFISHYGEITSEIVELNDSFGCEVEILGKGLKDLVVNYQFVFEVVETDNIQSSNDENSTITSENINIVEPDYNSPEIGIIDSGIMEGHKYISPSIIPKNSKSYLSSTTSVADEVKGGGHGTKVAGAVLYPRGVSNIENDYKLPFFVRNLKVLNKYNQLENIFPAKLMQTIVDDNNDCKIFNLSINSTAPYRTKHMSTWSAMLDTLIYENNVLFINSVGNIPAIDITDALRRGLTYPKYLEEKNFRVANPAQSSFSLTVGSINHISLEDDFWVSIGEQDEVSSFSRIGLGIWGSIKPEVVEYGGALKRTKDNSYRTSNNGTSIELINSTLDGSSAYSDDNIGTSFAAPKVAYIVGELKKLYPEENINLIRALVVQGARLPKNLFKAPSLDVIRYYGYGIPNLDRVTKNTEQRITFYSTNQISAEQGQIYSLKIPEFLREPENDYDILLEVTLAYTAKVRRTRQKTKSYLSTWLDWTSSKLNESYDKFKDFALKVIENQSTEYDKEQRSGLDTIKWKIHNRSNYGVKGLNRNNSTLQKDWAIIKSYDLPEELSFVVSGHKGWEKNKEEIPYALTISLEVLGENIPIYEEIRLENEVEITV